MTYNGDMSQTITKTQIVQARVTPKLKRDAEHILGKIGISTTDAFRMFLKQIVLQEGLPFAAKVPNQETLAAFREDIATLPRYTDIKKMHRDILARKI
jgi:DNA-damage-inducible protein J